MNALNPNIILAGRDANDIQAQIQANSANEFALSQARQQAPMQNALMQQQVRGAEMQVQGAEDQLIGQLLERVEANPDKPNAYRAALRIAQDRGIDISGVPQEYDPEFVQVMRGLVAMPKDQRAETERMIDELRAVEGDDAARRALRVALKIDPDANAQLRGTGKPSALQQRALDAGLQPGSEDYKRFMLEGGVEKNTETVFGPDGQPVFHRGPAGSAPKPLREFEAKALQFNERMRQSLPRVQAAEDALMQKGGPSMFDNAMENFGSLGNMLKSSEGQAYKAAALEWIAGILRLDSGAAVPESEFERYFKTYFFIPGDSEQTRENKKAARETAMDALGRIVPAQTESPRQSRASEAAPSGGLSVQDMSDEDLLKALGR